MTREMKMAPEKIEQLIDEALLKVFPPAATVVCVLSAIYFGAHVAVAWWRGWI